MRERQDLCPKCGRGFVLDNHAIPEHIVLKSNGTRSTVNCKGAGTFMREMAAPVVIAKKR